MLIKHINHSLQDDNFYDQQVNEYRMYATIQTLLNDWRLSDKNLFRLATYEDQLVKWLISEKKQHDEQIISEESTGMSRLLMKVMTKKLNEKYSGMFNEDQKSLVKAYCFSAANSDPTIIHKKLSEIKGNLLQRIEEYKNSRPSDKYINGKLNETREKILAEKLDNVDDELITRFMLYTKLGTELADEE